ncbi:molybdopterin oxidoreductase [Capsulimonas corticalis]|uniref:Molybdopterin oxidoreductase n=1 Tax=Capsulimonas corticalis TaxID=2219043 RepID=A0A402CRR0_9BACT|nr:molybdopterin oxidoreductase family protein [Capsulimonas corticalis]BDI28078.1 molybdopterin oxidoreductase [Capsulimonas corticalis]
MSSATATHCPYCALQCGMNLVSEGDLITVAARPDFPTNKGGLCQKGWTSADLIAHPDRLTSPWIRDRKGGELRPCEWDEALDRIVTEIRLAQQKYGLDSIGIFGGGGLTNEKAYMLGKFARVALRTPNIDYNGRFCMSSAAAAGIKAFGIDRGLPFPLEDIPGAETILLIGSNPAETMPPIMQYFEEHRSRGGNLIVADPRRTPTAQNAAVFLQLTPGTDGALANGLLHIAMADGLLDHDFIEARTTGFDAVRRTVASYWPDRVERITGVPVKDLTKAAHLMGEAATAMVLTARGAEQQSKGVENVQAFINLALALGKAGKPHCGYGCLTGQGNGQGGREHGQKADQLPGYRKIDNPAHRAYIAGVWGVDEATIPGPGRSAYELLDTLGTPGGVRALMVAASNVVVSAPRASHIEERLDALDFLLVSDIFLSETAARADVVLPVTQWAEEEGTMTNLEGRVLLRRRASEPPEGVRSDAQILKALADRLGAGQYFTERPREIFEELRRASAGGAADYAGVTYERIAAQNGVFWPCPSEDHPGTPRMFLDKFATEDGRAKFHPVAHREVAEAPDDEYPLYLTTGRVMAQYQSGTQTRRVEKLRANAPEAFVEIHPSLARRFGIADGDMVRLATRRGAAEAKARLTTSIRQDTIFVPFHWAGKGRANLLTNPALDPTSRMPEFKICAVQIAKL